MVVDVYSQQYEWHFNYPEQGVTSRELHVPVDRQIEFRMHSLDVIHSFWVPEWRIKKDNVPGITTRAYVTPTKAEDLTLVCTELCGFGHATMRAPVVVEKSQADFDKWATAQPPIPDSDPKPGETTPAQDQAMSGGRITMIAAMEGWREMTAALFRTAGLVAGPDLHDPGGRLRPRPGRGASQDLRAVGLPD